MDHNPFQCKACQTHLHQVTFARVLELSHGYKCSFGVVNTSHRNVRHVTKHLLQLILMNSIGEETYQLRRVFISVQNCSFFKKHSSAHLLNGAKFISM